MTIDSREPILFFQNTLQKIRITLRMKRNDNDQAVFGFTVGASGAGKGYCVGTVLKELHGIHTFVTGDWCREFCENEANSGIMVSDQLINNAVKGHFDTHTDKYYMIDAPRSIPQVGEFIKMYRERRSDCKLVTIHIDTTYEQSFRLLQHRAVRKRRFDDAKPEAVTRRLTAYFGQGGIFDRVIPYLQEHTEYHVVQHDGFSDPGDLDDSKIDLIIENTRRPVLGIGRKIFGHPTEKGIVAKT